MQLCACTLACYRCMQRLRARGRGQCVKDGRSGWGILEARQRPSEERFRRRCTRRVLAGIVTIAVALIVFCIASTRHASRLALISSRGNRCGCRLRLVVRLVLRPARLVLRRIIRLVARLAGVIICVLLAIGLVDVIATDSRL
jgi:hypothetical protein